MTPKLGSPPPVLTAAPEDGRTYHGPVWRVHRDAFNRPAWNELRHYGPVRGMRFDPHTPPEGPGKPEGVLYLATTAVDALAEAFQNRRRILTSDPRLRLLAWQPIRDVQLLDVNGQFGIRNGGAATLGAGPKRFTSEWAREIDHQLPDFDGLWHHSSMTGGDLVTLFTRVERIPLWPPAPLFNHPLNDSALRPLLLATAQRIGYDLAGDD